MFLPSEVICAALEALATIDDEESTNAVTRYLGNENPQVRLTACRLGIESGTEYMKSRVQYQLSVEKDTEVREKIQKALNEKKSNSGQ